MLRYVFVAYKTDLRYRDTEEAYETSEKNKGENGLKHRMKMTPVCAYFLSSTMMVQLQETVSV